MVTKKTPMAKYHWRLPRWLQGIVALPVGIVKAAAAAAAMKGTHWQCFDRFGSHLRLIRY